MADQDHRRELEALRAELEAERLRAQEARRRCALEARELREAAERERQLLADQLRSKWEQQRAREARQLREECRRQREAEIRQLLRWKEAELREAQELLQRERDAAMRQARDLQRQLAEELVSRRGGGGGGAGLSGECRARLQEVLGKLRWEVDGDQAARIRHLKAELELERSLFLKYILERFEGEQAPPGWPQRTRQAPLQQHSLAKNRPRSLESLVTGSSDATAAAAAASKSRSLDRNLSRCDSPPRLVSPPEGGFPKDSSCPQRPSAPQNALENETCSDDGAKEEKSVHAPPEGKVSSSGSGQESVPPAATQQQGWLASSSYSQLVKQNTELLKALLDLEQRCTHLKEENILLRKSSFPEMKEKVKRLKRKNGELADIAKRLEERAKKLQESSLKVGSAPIPLTMTCSDMNLYKTTFARQRAKDLSEQASALLAKDQQLEALQRECWELRAKLTTGKERTYLFSINDFDRLLRESQREVLRLQRQIMLKNLRESLQPSKIGLKDASSSVMQETPSTIHACLEFSSLPKELPKALSTLVKNGEPETALGNGAENNENCSSKTNSNTEYQLQVLKKKFVEKCKQCENLKHEMEKKQKTSDDLELQLNEVLSENVRFAEENSQLHEKTERTQKIENENAELKIKLLQATEDRNSAIQFTKGLEIKVENLEHVIRNMKEIAERQQQLESEHKETLLVLKNKEEEIQHLQQIQAEIKREHEESVQILESQVRELENQYHSQTEHFNLLSQELERLQIKKSGILESEVSQTTCNSSVTICPEKLEQETHHNFHCNKDIINKDSASIGTAGLLKKADQLESQVNSSGSLQNSSKCCLNSEEEKPDEVALETDKVSINLQLENQVSSKLHVFLARYSYDPFAGPNKNPEVELPLTAGEYVYIYGGMDEDGFYEGELMDGRRGMVPSNLVEEVSRNDLMSFLPSETSDFALHEMDFPCQSTNSEEKSDSPDEDRNVNLQSNRLGRELCDYQIAVPYPQNLTLIKQFSGSIIISWDPPHMVDSCGGVHSYNIYVNTDLYANVKHSSQMKAVIENLDLNLHSYRISVQSVTDKGNSDKMRCTFLVGNSFHIAPTLLQLRNITATSAEITWLPSNSNYSHAVYLNEKEYNVTNSGVYWYTFQNLEPGSQYSIKVETQDCNKVLEIPQGNWERKSAAITFTTPSTEPPDAPLDVQVQPSSSAGFLVITWLPVTIDAVGSSNGVKVIGYAVYINGQKVTESMSPTSGNVLLAVSQLHTFQETLKVSVRTVSPFGESEDSVPALIPPTLLRVPGSLWSKSVASTQASELTEDGHIHTVTGASSSIFSHMDMANTDTNFTVHFTSDCKELVAPMVVNISRNPMPFTTQMTSHNQGESDSILCRSNGKQSSDYALPSLMCEQSANPMLKLNLHAENMEREKAVSTAQPNSTKVKVYGQDTDTTAKYPSIQHRAVNSGANCSDSEPSVSSIKLEQKDSCRDGGTRKIFLQEEMGRLSKKKHTKQMKWLCDELPDLSVSQVENEEEQLSRTESRETHFGDQNDIPDFSDGEEEESLAYKRSIYVQKDAEPQDRAIPPAELAKDTGMTMTLKADRVTPSVPDFTDSGRLFVTLFDYDPITMSPNCNTAEEELSFKKGQILKVIGDKDVDGFYRGECEGKEGYIPCNMVSEIYIESKKVKEHLLKNSYIEDEDF
ncbi:peripheral-type benzodiazepine receptor-associated protein 1-like [Varanus komodoensis]|uniref:peripheral-type benzodiazepine receptor-associated protein 1-like n=1 Tax=Varanus komodoensis TaxID=61221 RepID=UPI001CF7713A|nr:peripheral-type benzodiazepine receptor-associated protein 1-like [Varanus komodoensis]